MFSLVAYSFWPEVIQELGKQEMQLTGSKSGKWGRGGRGRHYEKDPQSTFYYGLVPTNMRTLKSDSVPRRVSCVSGTLRSSVNKIRPFSEKTQGHYLAERFKPASCDEKKKKTGSSPSG